jgi:arylsulfatase A
MDKKTIRHHNPPLLFNLDSDPGERYDISANHPNVIRALRDLAEAHTKTISETR